MHSLDPVRFGLAAGLFSGVALFVLTLFSLSTGYAANFLTLVASLFPGFEVSVSGSLLGLLYGFLNAFVCFFVVAWTYNLLGPRID